MKEPLTEFGKGIRTLRISKGLTQAEMADQWDIDRSQVSVFETSKKLPSPRLVRKLSNAFQIDAFEWVRKDRLSAMKMKEAERTQTDPALALPTGAKLSISVNVLGLSSEQAKSFLGHFKSHQQGELYERAV